MRQDQLTHWSRVLAELRSRGYLARVVIDADCIKVEVKQGNREISGLVATAQAETAIADIVVLELLRCVQDVNHAPAQRFRPWVAGGRDIEDPIPKTEK